MWHTSLDLDSIKRDLKFGLEQEQKVLKQINKITKRTFYKTTNCFNHFDFATVDNKYFIELKTRTNARNKYNTTIINMEKIIYIKEQLKKNPERRFYFMFNFIDKNNNSEIYYIKYRSKVFKEFKTKPIKRYDRTIIKNHLLIPVDKLKPLKNITI